MQKKIKKTIKNKKSEPTYQLVDPDAVLLKDSATLTMSSQGQITIPKAWREYLGLEPGKKIWATTEEQNDQKTLTLSQKVSPDNWVEEMAGISTGKWGGSQEEIDANLRKMREEWDD